MNASSRRRQSAGRVLLLAITMASTAAFAQFTGPGAPAAPVNYTSVAEVLRTPVDDRPVQLTGTLLRQTGHDTYVFTDGSGEIQVEIDAEDFPRGIAIDATTRVTLDGEIDTRVWRAPEIDVDRVKLADLLPTAEPGRG